MSKTKGILGGLRFVIATLIVCVGASWWLVPDPDVTVFDDIDSGTVPWLLPSLPEQNTVEKSYKRIISWQKKNKAESKVAKQIKWHFRGVVRFDGGLLALIEENGSLLRVQKGDKLPGGEVVMAISENQLEYINEGEVITVVLYQ